MVGMLRLGDSGISVRMRWSTGVGGVIFMLGVSRAELGGVCGNVESDERLLLPAFAGRFCVWMAGGVPGGLSKLFDARRADMLFLSPLARSTCPPFVSSNVVLSGLPFGVIPLPSFLDFDLKTSLSFDPGETLRDELEGSSELPTDNDESFFLAANVADARGARLEGTGAAREGAGRVRERRFSLLKGLSSGRDVVAVIWGDDEVRYPVCEGCVTRGGGDPSGL